MWLPCEKSELDDIFGEDSPLMHPFVKVETPHRQLTYYRTKLNLIVCLLQTQVNNKYWISFSRSPSTLCLEKNWEEATRRSVKKIEEMMYIPLIDTLEKLMKCDYFNAQVCMNSIPRSLFVVCFALDKYQPQGPSTIPHNRLCGWTKLSQTPSILYPQGWIPNHFLLWRLGSL